MKPHRLPSIVDFLTRSAQQRLRYVRYSRQKGTIVRVCGEDSKESPRSVSMETFQIILDPFVVTPVHVDSRERVYVPQHGFVDVIVWLGGLSPQVFHLNMGDGCVIVPRNCPHALKTFATKTRIHLVTKAKRGAKVVWESRASRLCRKDGSCHWPSVR